jgi:NAD+ kinase
MQVVVERGASPYLARLEVYVGGVYLTTMQADGVIFSTPTGSTAYSLSAGGSMVHPAVPAILLTPICPHSLSCRPMILPDSAVVLCRNSDQARSDAWVSFDGKHRRRLQKGQSMRITMASHPLPTVNRVDDTSDWFDGIASAFHFNERPMQRPLTAPNSS